jgi:hypothetical protein
LMLQVRLKPLKKDKSLKMKRKLARLTGSRRLRKRPKLKMKIIKISKS